MSFDTDLIRALVAAQNGAPMRMGHPTRTVALPELGKDGYGCRPVFDAAVALCTGQAIHIACGGPHGLTWRVEWHDRFNPKRVRYAGVLDPFQRLFTTTASGTPALQGFALAALGLAWATPTSGFQGEWASLLATFGVTGEQAFSPRCFEALRDAVLEALRGREIGATHDAPHGDHGFPMWRFAMVADALDLPALDNEPGTLANARRRYAHAPTAAILADLGLFTATSAAWRRDAQQMSTAEFVRTQNRDLLHALMAGQHAVLSGPAGEGKSQCVRSVFGRLTQREILRATTPEIPLALYSSVERLFGSCGGDGVWVDGPLRAAMTSGTGEMIHLSCVDEPSAEVMALLRVAMRQSPLPADLVHGAPATEIGADFRIVLELTVPDLTMVERGNVCSAAPTAGALQGIAALAWIMFLPPSGQEAELLLHGSGESRHPSLLYLVRYVVEEVEIAVGKGILPRRLSLAEIMSWVRMADTILHHAGASDVTEMLESAARASWVQSMPAARVWWNTTDPLAQAEAVLRRHVRVGALPQTPFEWDEGMVGVNAWDASDRIRQTIDDITACVSPESILILEGMPAKQTEYGSMCNGWWKLDTRFCTVRMRTARPSVDAFVEAVNTAAHERAHARWTPAVLDLYYPLGRSVPDDETPELERRRLYLQQAFNLIEDHRIERLLDRLEEPTLQVYRHKAAVNALALWEVVDGPMSQRIASCLHIYTLGCTVDAEHAWSRAIDTGAKSGVPPVPLRSALHLMAMVESCLEDCEPLPDSLGALTDLFERADGELPV